MGTKTILVLLITFSTILMFLLFKTKKLEQPIEFYYNFTQGNHINDNNNNKLFDHDFKYITNNPRICKTQNESNILGIIMVTSYFSNVETRSAIRRAFPQTLLYRLRLRRIFLLGLAPEDKYTNQNAIENESERFADLIQGNFKEAYRNLTYKHLMGLKWVSCFCKNAKYVIKMDDDIVVNLYKVYELLIDLKLPNSAIAGYILQGMVPIREPLNKWYVTKQEFERSMYPTFVSGWFYVTNQDVLDKLIETSKNVKYFWIDDLYVTGLLAEKLDVKHYNWGKYFTVHPDILKCCIKDVKKLNYDCEILIGPNGGDNNLFYHFNKAMARCFYKSCLMRHTSLNNTCVGEGKFPLGKGSAIVKKLSLI